MTIKFHDKDKPTSIARAGKILLVIGALPILIEFLLMSMAGGMPLGMRMVWYVDFMPDISFLYMSGIFALIIGWILSQFKWKTGELHFTNTALEITGTDYILIPFESEVELFDFPKHPNKLKLKSRIYSSLILKFDSESAQRQVTAQMENLI